MPPLRGPSTPTRLFNVTVTNVPGPQVTLYAAGARLREILPLVPLAAEHAVGIAILSYDGRVFFGINVAADAVPDVDVLRDGIAGEIETLRESAAVGADVRPLNRLPWATCQASYPHSSRRWHDFAYPALFVPLPVTLWVTRVGLPP